jgi:Kef-type K+ transport system membrane component KefB
VTAPHLAAAAAAVLLLAWLGRAAARALGQPPVIGEIAAGLAAGPVVVAVAGRPALDAVLPATVLAPLERAGEIGLALFLVGVAYHVRPGRAGIRTRTIGWVVAGAAVPSLAAGAALAGWIVRSGDPGLRGGAPAPAFVLMLAVALTVTAVPVLARILAGRGLDTTPVGTLALACAVVLDAAMWALLAVALALAAGWPGRSLAAAGTLAAGVVALLAGRVVLRGRRLRRAVARHPVPAAATVAVATVAAALVTSHQGLTAVLGAVLVGFALPDDRPAGGWSRPVQLVGRVGTVLVPLFFVATGVRLLVDAGAQVRWSVAAAIVVLATGSKVAGGFLGARAAGLPPAAAVRIGVLMNTRGLTEIAVLHAGLKARLVTPGLFLALLVMALVTTAATGPLLSLVDRWARRPRRAARPGRSGTGREGSTGPGRPPPVRAPAAGR